MGLLGSMSVSFGGDASGLMGVVSQAKSAVSGLASMPMGAIAGGLAVVAGAIVGIGVTSVQAASDFQGSMLKVQAYAGLSKQQTDDLGNSILTMAAKMGQAPKAMADAIYPIISSGYSASQALNILGLSAETSAASGAKMSVVADMLTTALKASGAPASDAGHYMDMFNKIVSLGKGEVPAYAAIIGKLSLAAQGAQVPFSDMGGALATLTTHGFPSVAQAATSLGNLFTQIGPKVDALKTHATKLGLAFDENKFKTLDLAGKLAYLKDITGGNQGELLKLLGGSTMALKAFTALSGSAKDFTDNLAAMKNSTGATDAAFQTASSGFGASMARMQASVQVLQVKIGSALLPALTGIVNAVTPIISKFAVWISSSNIIPTIIDSIVSGVKGLVVGVQVAIGVINGVIGVIENVVQWFIQWQTPISVVAGILVAFFLPAIISAGVQAVVSGAQITASFISSMVKSGVEAVANGAKVTASFIGSVIKSGAEAWISGGKVVGSFVASMVTSGTQSVIAGAKIVAGFIASVVSSGAKAVVSGAQIVASFVAGLITTGAQAIATGATIVASFVAGLITTGAQAIATGATLLASFVAGLITTGVQAAITGALIVASVVPAIIAVATEAITAAAVAIPGLVIGFIAWAVAAGAAAIATLTAAAPFIALGALIAAVVVGIILAVKNWGAIWTWLQGVWGNIISFFQGIITNVQTAFSGFGKFVAGIWTDLGNGFKGAINFMISGMNGFIHFMNGIHIDLPAVFAGPVQILPAVHIALPHLNDIPLLATGGVLTRGGLVGMNEEGAEVVSLPTGAAVYPHGSIPAGNGGGQGGVQHIYVELDGQLIGHVSGNWQAKEVRVRTGRRAA